VITANSRASSFVRGTPDVLARHIGGRDAAALLSVVLAAVAIPLGLAAAAGAIGLPSNDDWVYIRSATHLFDTGNIDWAAAVAQQADHHVAGHVTAFLGQLFLSQPFLWLSGGDPWAFTAFGLTMAAIGIGSTYLLARRFVGIGSALLVVMVTLSFPGFIRTSASFMTDVPAFGLVMLCLLLGTLWLQDVGGRSALVASLAVGLIAFSIREFAAAGPLAVLVAGWARNRPSDRSWLVGSSIFVALGGVAVVTISRSSTGQASPSTPGFWGVTELPLAFATLAAVVLPAVVLAVAPRIRGLSPKLIIAATLACLALIPLDKVFLGNLWTADGLAANQLLAGARDPVFGEGAWAVSRLLAIGAAILTAILVTDIVRHRVPRQWSASSTSMVARRIMTGRAALLIVFLLGYGVGLLLYGVVGGLFDRYLYPMVPVAAILLLLRPVRPWAPGTRQAMAHGTLIWLMVSAFVIAGNSFAYDTARYREGQTAVALGYDAATVDAGYEWVGMYGSGLEQTIEPTGVNWWQAIWSSFRPCAILSNSQFELDGYRLVRVNQSAYRQFLFFGPDQALYLYGADLGGCPTLPIVSAQR
jgi:hypothetical protein